jgi:hypothetical protein
MRRGFKQWAEKQASACRARVGLSDIAPLPARTLANTLNIRLLVPNDIPGVTATDIACLSRPGPSRWSAVTVETPWGTFVLYNPTHSAARCESDLMHELAHILCHHTTGGFVRLPDFPFTMREYDAEQEEEAVWLGASLQLPRAGLLRARQNGMNIEAIADHYGASQQQVQYRLNITGIEKQLRRGFVRR